MFVEAIYNVATVLTVYGIETFTKAVKKELMF